MKNKQMPLSQSNQMCSTNLRSNSIHHRENMMFFIRVLLLCSSFVWCVFVTQHAVFNIKIPEKFYILVNRHPFDSFTQLKLN